MNRLSEADEMRATMRAMKIPASRIEAAIALAESQGLVERPSNAEAKQADTEEDDRLEKAIVAAADKRMRALGFTVWNLSQPRASKIAAGVPDRLYTSPARGLALYWEAKTARGEQRPDQRVFQEHCEACGLHYVVGTDSALLGWLAAHNIQLDEG
jgi:hypothetical protein